jgi:transcriptional regulator with PAS, ATPase and Fis domain
MTASYDAKETQDLKQGKRGGPVIALRNIATGEMFSLEDGPRRWLVGKDEGCDLRVYDPAVSGIHFILERRSDGAFLVRDRDSTNGTMIDAHRIEAAELRSGSYITFGRTTLLAIGPVTVTTAPRAIEQWKGSDPKSRAVLDRAIKAAQSDCSVLVVGETGTGKDLVARMIHESSRRSNGPFVAVNCGAIPRELIGSELFGHERGAFTGATESREGYFVEAHGGTLFLDEIGELPIELQPHLLRVLETRRVRSLGGQAEKAVDVRIIAATNREANLGTDASPLRVDLYHRVATVVLKLPALRERMGDLIDIVHSLMKEYPGAAEKTITKEAWHALSSYAWPGNVREVRHTVERAITLGGQCLGPADFFSELATRGVPRPLVGAAMLPYQVLMRASMERALDQHRTIRAAAQSIGMPKSTFADKAREYGLELPKRSRKRRDDE